MLGRGKGSRWHAVVLTLTISVVLAACGTSAVSPTVQSTPNNTKNTDKANWEELAEWKQTVEAAKVEKKLVISIPSSEEWRKILMTFQEDYPDIKLDITTGNSRDFWPRITQERKVGQYLWDFRIGGADSSVWQAKKEGMLEPIRPMLILPEVLDGSKWLGGMDGIFSDNERKYVVAFLGNKSYPAFVNRDVIPESELITVKGLTDPKWKGKIVMSDPRGGAGQVNLAFLLKVYGEDFVKQLMFNQNIVITKDLRQLSEWVIRQTYPVGFGLRNFDLIPFIDQGLGKNIKPLAVEEGAVAISPGSGGIQYLNNAPHPNASKVFINWLLSAKVQERLAVGTKWNSRRLDVKYGDPDAVIKPEELSKTIYPQDESGESYLQRIADMTTKLK
ncbi:MULTISPECIES: extracellular solute-binding protein [unclassified Paenibacillus]|uniref:ABC transporter substrate-binding protein n=1 Tax=unclassified Paenibacillus TaxID=185978 RepID=UPI001FD7C545|nr:MULTISPECIES: extracellular solute-binding protein [unclassified Paenibacillus]